MWTKVKEVIKTVCYMIFVPLYVFWLSMKYILTGRSLKGRIIVFGIYSGIIAAAFMKPICFFVIIAIILLLDLIISLMIIKEYENSESDERNNRKNDSSSAGRRNRRGLEKNPFFEGMTYEEAKKEYRKLMKKYHPDNANGSLVMTQKISEAYREYCARM